MNAWTARLAGEVERRRAVLAARAGELGVGAEPARPGVASPTSTTASPVVAEGRADERRDVVEQADDADLGRRARSAPPGDSL